MRTYCELEVWVRARELSSSIYSLTKGFPQEELYGIVMQMRRAAVSVASNIAEGCGCNHKNESIHFFHIARGSLYELETQCYLAYDQCFIVQMELNKILTQIVNCKKLLNGFVKYYENKLNR